MTDRQTDRQRYFNELATTSQKYFIPYINCFKNITSNLEVLEIGCGDGGNLLPFARMGCSTIGIDIAKIRIDDAIRFFKQENAKGEFISQDIFAIKEFTEKFDLILIHDVYEHILDKRSFLEYVKRFIKSDGIIFISFPAWQMPFGGHQQICKSKFLSRLPFFHLLPSKIYKWILINFKEDNGCITELLNIKQTRTSIGQFEKNLFHCNLNIIDKRLYFINPHYEIKFNLKPRKLCKAIGGIPYLRNFFTTSCFYIIDCNEKHKS